MEPVCPYDASKIVILEGLEAVRRRPAMYVGGLDREGLHHLALEPLESVVDDALAGEATRVDIEVLDDRILQVADDGPGLPVEPHGSGKSLLEVIFTVLHACACGCGERAGHRRHHSGGGLSVVNALSEVLDVETTRAGIRYQARFAGGRTVLAPAAVGPAETKGTSIRFRVDPTIFPESCGALDPGRLAVRASELVALVPGLRIAVSDRRPHSARKDEFGPGRGIADLLAAIEGSHPIEVHAPSIDAAIRFEPGRRRTIVAFQDLDRRDEGDHVDAFLRGLRAGLGQRIPLGLVACVSAFGRDTGAIERAVSSALARR